MKATFARISSLLPSKPRLASCSHDEGYNGFGNSSSGTKRARNHCEYCLLPQSLSPLASLQIEHVIPKKHGGDDALENLALACIDCNLHKGTNVAGYDPVTGGERSFIIPVVTSGPIIFSGRMPTLSAIPR